MGSPAGKFRRQVLPRCMAACPGKQQRDTEGRKGREVGAERPFLSPPQPYPRIHFLLCCCRDGTRFQEPPPPTPTPPGAAPSLNMLRAPIRLIEGWYEVRSIWRTMESPPLQNSNNGQSGTPLGPQHRVTRKPSLGFSIWTAPAAR